MRHKRGGDAGRVVDPGSTQIIDGKIYAVQSEEHNQTVTARHVYVMTRNKLKLVSGDGEITEVDRRRTKIIGRIRWIWREL